MRAPNCRSIRLFLSFLLVLASSQALSQNARCVLRANRPSAEASLQLPSTISEDQSTLRFRLETISDGKANDGTWWKRFNFLTSAGNKVVLQKFPFSSVERAQKELNVFLKHSSKVIDRASGADGAENGERLVLEFQDRDRQKSYAICWTQGPTFSQIAGIRLPEILEFEKRLKTKPFADLSKEF
jgi:hypothetical protein